MSHGRYVDYKGSAVSFGSDTQQNMLAEGNLDGFFSAGYSDYLHAVAPLSCIIWTGCWSAETQQQNYNLKNAWHDDNNAWIYIGSLGMGNSATQSRNFVSGFCDAATDLKKSYKKAYCAGKWWADAHTGLWYMKQTYKSKLFSWKGGYLDHNTKYDKYRKIDRIEDDEGSTFTNEIIQEYERDFSGKTNGGYVVFHCRVNDGSPSWQDMDANLWATIQIKVEKDLGGGQYQEITKATYSQIKNRKFDYTTTGEYGGSDICSLFVSASDCKNLGKGTFKISVKITGTGSSCQSLYVNRFEFMEIGK